MADQSPLNPDFERGRGGPPNTRGVVTTPVPRHMIQRIADGARNLWRGVIGTAMSPATTDAGGVPGTPNPPYGPGMSLTPQQQPYGWRALEVRREPWMGPGHPMTPVAPRSDVVGRAFDYQPNRNLGTVARGGERVSFQQLRTLAESFDLVRLAIETRKDQMAKLEFSILPKKKQKDELRSKATDECIRIEEFLRRPDRRHGWDSWLRLLLEDHFVLDAATVYVRRTTGGDVYSLDVIDGSTIIPLLDVTGRQPEPPDPAYQQILRGMPAVNYTADEMLYVPRNPRPGKVYGMSPCEQIIMTVNVALRRELAKLQYYCYSDDTEVLTRTGWKRFADCAADEEFATRQIGTGRFEWQRAYDTFRKRYTGQLIHFSGRSLDLLVTPNHRMLVNSLPARAKGRHEMSVGGEHVISAEQMMQFGTPNTGIPQTSVWEGREIGAVVFRSADRRAKDVTISGDDYCAFMGMYLAEGNLNGDSIVISQPPDGRGAHDTYRALLERVFGTGITFYGHQFEVCRHALAHALRPLGKAHEKYIPDDIRDATPRQLAIFWHYYALGDGRAAGDDGSASQQVFTTSRRLADHLTEVIQKMGGAATVWTRKAGRGRVGNREVNAREGYMVTRGRRAATKGWKARLIDYDAPVACVCVPNKFLYVRRNGKACWSGNTEGNVPEALCSVPKDWTPAQISEFQAMWDAIMSDQAARRKMKFVPGEMAVQFTRDNASLMDTYDEWLARVICYAFSLPALPFIRMQNRATAETAYETAVEEGLQPMMLWVKGLMDRIVQEVFGRSDLEFVWDDIEKITKAERDAANMQKMQQGILSMDEVRAEMGLSPLGMKNAIFGIGPNGLMFIDDLVEAHQQGLLKMQPPPDPMAGFGMPGALPGDPGFIDGEVVAPDAQMPPQARPQQLAPPVVPAGPAAPGLDEVLAGVDPRLLAAVGLGPGGRAERLVDVRDDEEMESDPLAPHVAHPEILKTLRDFERNHLRR